MGQTESVEFARKFLQDIISFFGENVEVTATVEEDVIELYVESSELNSILIGRNAETLRSLQYIVSTGLRNQDAELTRVNVDVADYKKQREEKVAEQARARPVPGLVDDIDEQLTLPPAGARTRPRLTVPVAPPPTIQHQLGVFKDHGLHRPGAAMQGDVRHVMRERRQAVGSGPASGVTR